MQLKNLFTDEDAVSPVIGVILMVAITVILAAVIGAFVLGIGGSQEKVPQASFSYNADASNTLEVTHEGGDEIDASRIEFSGSGNSNVVPSSTPSDWSAGTTLTSDSGTWNTGDDVQVIWSSSSSDQSNIIAEGTI
ncbi:type IV pilin [Halorubellus sp. JP-L1]|uniref:type IV pilin n=1 Tax=Halorubellus sp. JP-L1 TaxID=2715753 RepID=UPI00140924F0|nr:type IV pilin N-terminal domain-containing protein [Halorubellus sp. JP-L1]NHN41233.1 type IV pilin [Halorubellus sp. JP-L1]